MTTYCTISAAELEGMRQEEDGVLIIDLRNADRYARQHLPAAVSFPFVPTWFNRLFQRRTLARLLGPDRNRRIVFY